MNCPVCDEKLREVEKHGVTVDICPGCKGVWLDRGELEKVIEMVSSGADGGPLPAAPADERREASRPVADHREYEERRPVERERDRDDDRDRGYEGHRSDPRYRDGHRRRGGLLGEIFEMFGD